MLRELTKVFNHIFFCTSLYVMLSNCRQLNDYYLHCALGRVFSIFTVSSYWAYKLSYRGRAVSPVELSALYSQYWVGFLKGINVKLSCCLSCKGQSGMSRVP